MLMLPKLISSKKNHTSRIRLLYLRHAMEVINKTDLNELNPYLVAQYAIETNSFNPKSIELCSKFLLSHRPAVFEYVIYKYSQLLDNCIAYLKLMAKEYQTVVFPHEIMRTVLSNLDTLFDTTNGAVGHPHSSLKITNNEHFFLAESTDNLLQSEYFKESQMKRKYYDGNDEKLKKDIFSGIGIQPEQLLVYVDKLPDKTLSILRLGFIHDKLLKTDHLENNVMHCEFVLKFFGHIINSLILLIKEEFDSDLKNTLEKEYARCMMYLSDSNMGLKYRYLADSPMVNIVCTGDGVVFNQNKEHRYPIQPYSLAERYLVLAEQAHIKE